MDIRQIQQEVAAVELLAKYQPIIETILTTTEEGIVMSVDQRKNWIQGHVLEIKGYGPRAKLFVESFINGTTDMGNCFGLDQSALGRFLLKRYSSNDIIYACTYYAFQNAKNKRASYVFTLGNPPLLKEERKEYDGMGQGFGLAGAQWHINNGIATYSKFVKNCRVQVIESTRERDDTNPPAPIVPKRDLEKIIKGTPDFVVTLDKEKFQKLRFEYAYESQATEEQILENLPTYEGGVIKNAPRETELLATPILFEIDGESIAVPNFFISYIEDNGIEGRYDYRFFKTDDGYIIDASVISSIDVEVEIEGKEVTAKAKIVENFNCFVFDEFNTYPAIFVKYDPLNPDKQPPTLEEVKAAEVEVLTLPNAILANQMRVAYRGKRVPLSAMSLDKWSKSDTSFGSALEIMEEHISYFTSVNDAGIRTNNGIIYEQTKAALGKRLTDAKGKLNKSVFNEVMSKYAYTLEETFFNLNPDFSNPAKLLGYFLGMGITPNNLYINQVSPYRILCARLLGIDYAVNYFDLCKEAVIEGHLFVASFTDDARPVFCNADVFLEGNFYAIKAKIETDIFRKEIEEFFGSEQSTMVMESHENLLKENSPKFMKLHHGTPQEYEGAVRDNGIGTPYKEDRLQEMTRITMALGLFETSNQDLSGILNNLLANTSVLRGTPYLRPAQDMMISKLKNSRNTRIRDGNEYFQDYANAFDGVSLYGRATNKLRYNDLTKSDAIQDFYFDPQSAKAGTHRILSNGLTLSNKELGDDGSERKTGVIKLNWRNGKYNEPPKVDVKFVLDRLGDGGNGSILNELGYKDSDEKELAGIIVARSKGLYHEIASQARNEGDELYSLALALVESNGSYFNPEKDDFVATIELLFNMKYNNFALKPFSRVPIFLENNRTFGETGRFVATEFKEDGSPAGFSLRQAQRDGLRFLGASGNSGLLAHEVGFGKTTSSIAKVSDLLLRGDAKRVLISVPNPVYDSGNWEEEIQGLVNDDGRRLKNGLLPSNITLVKVGSMNLSDLLGKKVDSSSPEYAEKSEGTGYDGPMAYSPSDLELMEKLRGTTEGLLNIVGGALNKYGKNKENSMITPQEQKHGYGTKESLWIEQNPFFKKSEPYKKSDIIRLNDSPRQTLAGLTTTIKSGDFDFWDIGDSDYMEFGKLSDIEDGTIESKNSFLKSVYEDLIKKSPSIMWDEEDGGDLKRIMKKLDSIHKKYANRYSELITSEESIEKVGRGSASVFGGYHDVTSQSVTSFFKKYPEYNQAQLEKSYGEFINPEDGTMGVYPYVWIAIKTKEILDGKAKDTSMAWWPYYGTRSFWNRVVLPWAMKNHKNSSLDTLIKAIGEEFPFTQKERWMGNSPELRTLAIGQIKTALELQMTEEVAYFFQTLSRQAPLFLGKFKEWALRPNSVILCSHLAIPKFSVSEKFGAESVDFIGGIYGNSNPIQYLNGRMPTKYKKKPPVVQSFTSTTKEFQVGVRTRGQKEKLFLSQYRGMDINLLSCDAFVVDEVHNFNRAFNKVKKGSRVADVLRGAKSKYYPEGKEKEFPTRGGKVQANVKGALRYPENVYAYDTKANYNIRGEVQNFIAVCLYFQDRGRIISQGMKRTIENTIFLSATPFTDDNFQMLSLFGSLNTRKLMQSHVFNTFDFFQLYAKELWQKDIDYQNRYTLFPKIVGYKNIYALSQLIKSFTNFKISDAEIEAQRPQKVIVGTDPIRIQSVTDESLSKVLSQVPFNEVQEKMNVDLNRYITLESDSELSYTDAQLAKAEEIYEKLQKTAKKGNPADEKVKELRKLVKVKKRKGKPDLIDYDGIDTLVEIENLVDEIFELDPENPFAKSVRSAIDDVEIEAAEGDDDATSDTMGAEDEDDGAINANAVKNEDSSLSLAQKIAQRALEASRTQQLTLISPYYLTINNDKKLMNPYLPPLDGTFSQNAKNVVENSPKLLYACKAIRKVLEFAFNEKGQTYGGENETEPIMGQVVYANNYKFRYHGKDFFLFDLMKQYIIDENRDLLEKIVEGSTQSVEDVFASIDGRTKAEKTEIVDAFLKGYCLVLFGTEIIKEGINLQKNCPIMYILQVGFVPVTYMQLHGRIWRQKNPYKYAFLINVLTQNSIDAFVYSKLEQKIKSVQQMLGSEVYDSEATQFDVDVAEIKTSLITDPEKLAEMEWENVEQETSREVDSLKEQVRLIRSVASGYPSARERYEKACLQMNTFSELVFKIESYIVGKFFAEKTNRQRTDVATQKLLDVQYPAQFPNEKERDEFEKTPLKFQKKDGTLKYEVRNEMSTRLRKGVTITEMTIDEGIKEVIELNASSSAEVEFKLPFKTPIQLGVTSSLGAFYEESIIVLELAEKCGLRLGKLERDQSRSAVREEYLDPAKKLVEAGLFKPMSSEVDPKKVVEELGLNGSSRGQYNLRGEWIVRLACYDFVFSNVDDYGINYLDIRDIIGRFKMGDDAITIGAFNDYISGEQIEDGDTTRFATIEDIDGIVERKEKSIEEMQYTLDNDAETKEKLRVEFAEKIAQRQGETIPSVEERVNDLEAIFPYLERQR